jgi:hypothetical protein
LEPLIAKAVERGVAYLRAEEAQNGLSAVSGYPLGGTALAGLALMECGLRAEDPTMERILAKVRDGAVTADKTYILSLFIMLLDRANDPADIPLIESMAVRLVGGQNLRGGWTYDCPVSRDASEVRRLTAVAKNREKIAASQSVPRRRRDVRHEPRQVSPEIVEQFKAVSVSPRTAEQDDNSNTQFATMALWVASRYDLPVDDALARVEDRFRLTQNPNDGGWGYNANAHADRSTTSMTCAGLLGLAIGHGVRAVPDSKLSPANRRKQPDLTKDPAVLAGLQVLATAVGVPRGGLIQPDILKQIDAWDYYFLWSLERVAVAYGLNTIGHKDWYHWGAEILLATQAPDGAWGGAHERGIANTSFALLFLRRANLAEDLTATLRGKMGDPGERTLRRGGIGGDAMKRYVLAPGNNPQNRGTEPSSNATSPAAPGLDPDVAPLVRALVEAADNRQAELIAQYQESKGTVYTQALAAAIHRLDGTARTAARDALAERLYRMTAQTLRDKLKDSDEEVRSAAALACGMKKDNQYVPDLIASLDDMDRRVVRAAYIALKNISNQDFGPSAAATAQQRTKAIAAWKDWWQKQNP